MQYESGLRERVSLGVVFPVDLSKGDVIKKGLYLQNSENELTRI